MATSQNRTTSLVSEQSTDLLQYHVYTLTNPIDNAVFYVGCSMDTRNRFYGHVADIAKRSGQKGVIVKRILKAGLMPSLETIDTIFATDPKIAHYVEQYWILYLRAQGAVLVNRNDATPSWRKAPPYATIEFIKSIAYLPLEAFSSALAEYQMRAIDAFGGVS